MKISLINSLDTYKAKIKQLLNKSLNECNMDKVTDVINFKVKIEDLIEVEEPEIIFKPLAYLKMITIINETNSECAWHGFVTRDGNKYIINDIEVYPQIVSGATVDADEEKYPLWVIQHTDEQICSMRLQGHSHVNMGTSPSGTDLAFFDDLTKQVRDYYIFIIQNKKGEFNLRLVNKEQGYILEGLDYTIEGIDDWYNQAKELLQTKTYKQVTLSDYKNPQLENNIVRTSTMLKANGPTMNGISDIDDMTQELIAMTNEAEAMYQFTYMCSKTKQKEFDNKYVAMSKDIEKFEERAYQYKTHGFDYDYRIARETFQRVMKALKKFMDDIEDETNGGIK